MKAKKVFLFEKFDSGIEFDFQHVIRNQVNNVFCDANKDFHIEYTKIDYLVDCLQCFKDCIPIGSIQFVQKFFKEYHNYELKPINIPYDLFTPYFLNRRCSLWSKDELLSIFSGDKFIKSQTRFKDICDFYTYEEFLKDKNLFNDDFYIVSDKIDIKSEFRVFVHRNKIQDVKQYAGDWIYPLQRDHITWILKAIEAFKYAPIAYTLDLCLINDKTHNELIPAILEVHDFFSVGLYGFENEKIPYMFSQWYYEKVKNIKNENNIIKKYKPNEKKN